MIKEPTYSLQYHIGLWVRMLDMFHFQNLRKKSTYYLLHESNIIMNAKIDQYLEEVKTFMLEYLEHPAMKKTFANAVIQILRAGRRH